ncbi:MAG: discoidin domain-containing protein [Planctomycetota bacterium]
MLRVCGAVFVVGVLFAGSEKCSANLVGGVTATATSEIFSGPFDRQASNAVNGSIDIAEGGYWQSAGIGFGFGEDRDPEITFDLNATYSLNSMRIWNSPDPPNSIRRTDVQISTDGINFTSIGEQTFDLFFATTNPPVIPPQDFQLNGAIARYVRFDVLESGDGTMFPFEVGLPSGTGTVGIAEVQFFSNGTAIPEASSFLSIAVVSLCCMLARRSRSAASA